MTFQKQLGMLSSTIIPTELHHFSGVGQPPEENAAESIHRDRSQDFNLNRAEWDFNESLRIATGERGSGIYWGYTGDILGIYIVT